jgi:hypothetical protein
MREFIAKGIWAIFLLFSLSAFSEEISIGAGYPYFSFGYDTSIYRRYELRVASGSKIDIAGVRGYHFLDRGRISPFLGTEVCYLWFKDNDLKGEGWVGSLFMGGELCISRRVSLLTDFSLCYIYLKAKGYSQEGIEPVFNMGMKIRLR